MYATATITMKSWNPRIYAHHSSNAVSFFTCRKTTIFILINLASAAFVCCWNVHDRKKFSELISAVDQR
jgi:hypothetical protein